MPSLILPESSTEPQLLKEKNTFRKKCLELLDDYETLQADYLMLSAQLQLVHHRSRPSEESVPKRKVSIETENSPRNSVLSVSPTVHGGSCINPVIPPECISLSAPNSPRQANSPHLIDKRLISLDSRESKWETPAEDSYHQDNSGTVGIASHATASIQLGKREPKVAKVQRPVPVSSITPATVVTDTSAATTLLGEQILPAFAVAQQSQTQRPSFENYRTHKSIQEAHMFKADCGVFMPSSFARMFWNLCIICALMFELWLAPFKLIFCEDDAMPSSVTVISIFTTVFFFLDILLNFNTGYFKNGKIVVHRGTIIRHYLKYWFLVDFISAVPWPFEGSGFLRWLRFGKIVRLVKAMQYVEFARSVQALSSMHTGKFSIDFHFRHFAAPLGLLLCLSVHAHLHGCLWASWQPNWERAPSFEKAWHNYLDSFLWAFGAFTAGTWRIPTISATDTSTRFWWAACVLEIFVMWERICFLAGVIIWGVCQAHTKHHDYMLLQKLKSDALEYLKSHNVSFGTQVQVMYILHETGSVRQKQRHFRDLMNNDLPVEVKRKICSELWSERLKSLELIDMMNKLHHHFLMELALLVRQEVFASKAIIFHYGDASIASYYVMDGSVVSITNFDVPEFVTGHWIGETALVNRLLRRRMTVMAASITVLMAVPADGFHDLLSRTALVDQFQDICHEYLWKGLCGRCGALGHHNADSCPLMDETEIRMTGKITGKAIWSSLPGAPTYRRKSKKSERMMRPTVSSDMSFDVNGQAQSQVLSEASAAVGTAAVGIGGTIIQKMNSLASGQFLSRVASSPYQAVNRDLQQFLTLHNLGRLIPTMSMLKLKTLQDLADIEFEELNSLLAESGEHLAPPELLALSKKSINDFREKVARTVHRHIFGRRNYHYVFLSHSKREAGTEASLMQKELAELISQDASLNETHNFDVPVFLDSENLQNLKDIQEKVQKSHNLCVMLTTKVLTRPWVLVEIVTAIRASVQVIPVRVTKPGVEFEFPGEEFYERISKGEFLDVDGQQILTDAGVSLMEVESSLRELFRQIAVPYSPHNRSEIRQTELKAFLARCRVKHFDQT